MQQFFNFGEDDEPIVENTFSRIEKAENRCLLNALMQAQALTFAYENASQLNFDTVNQVDEVANTLELQYQQVINDSCLEPPTLLALTDLRTRVQALFEAQKLTASQVINVKTTRTPSRALAYQYYGSSSRGFDIAQLNADQNLTFIKGPTDIFTE
jgi:prophage DNA circulation protein